MPSDKSSKPQSKPQPDKIKDLPSQKASSSRDQQVKGGMIKKGFQEVDQ